MSCEINHILKHGIQVRTEIRFGSDLSLEDLREDGFSAVFLGIGAHDSIHMRIPGEDQTESVIDAVGFLRDVNLGKAEVPGKQVIVIGGGVMGTSTAYHLAKLGCRDVVLLEKEQLASGSTGLSVGGIRQQFSTEANIRISQESVKVFERFEEEFETEIDFRQYGYGSFGL